jgi:hypothetical protein
MPGGTRQQRIRLTALSDQAWAALASHCRDIFRIADHGPTCSDKDRDIVRMVFCCVAGNLHTRAYDAETTDGNDSDD